MQAVAISLFRFEGLWNRAWAFGQMQFARAPLKRLPGLGFFKLFGTGTGEGFTPVPNFGVYAIMTTWPSLDAARSALATAPVFARYRAHAAEHCTIHLSALAARGLWDGRAPFEVTPSDPNPDLMAVITRATLKPRHVLRFWSHTPDISTTIRAQTHLRFKIGMGEVPWFQQVTFSIWDDAKAMVAFAYRSDTHAAAVKAVRDNHWFREELYARFRVLDVEGSWNGGPVLSPARAALPAAL